VVVKSQIHAGGRGKGQVHKGDNVVSRGVEVVQGRRGRGARRGVADARRQAGDHPDRPRGQLVRTVFVEQGINIARELYLGMLVDRDTRRVVVMASAEGGMDIEHVAATTPEKILKVWIDPTAGSCRTSRASSASARAHQGPGREVRGAARVALQALRRGGLLARRGEPADRDRGRQRRWRSTRRSTSTTTPTSVTRSGRTLRDPGEEDPTELEAKKPGCRTCRSTATSAAWSTARASRWRRWTSSRTAGGTPANFLDVGGGATEEAVTKAFSIILDRPR
jgi:succinyl-CoA synthetase beta subunit